VISLLLLLLMVMMKLVLWGLKGQTQLQKGMLLIPLAVSYALSEALFPPAAPF
jgi:hypothetical protein